jgi:rhodanese-related sulfurtransferase
MPSKWNSARFDPRFLLLLLGTGFTLAISGCGDPAAPSGTGAAPQPFRSIYARELKAMLDRGEALTIVDVRSTKEYLSGHLPNAVSIPYEQIPYRYKELDPETKTVVYCRIGVISVLAARELSNLGFSDLINVTDGFSAWKYAVELKRKNRLL